MDKPKYTDLDQSSFVQNLQIPAGPILNAGTENVEHHRKNGMDFIKWKHGYFTVDKSYFKHFGFDYKG